MKKNQEPEPLGKKSGAGAGAGKKFAGSPALEDMVDDSTPLSMLLLIYYARRDVPIFHGTIRIILIVPCYFFYPKNKTTPPPMFIICENVSAPCQPKLY